MLAGSAKALAPELARHIDPTIIKAWQRMPRERRQFLEEFLRRVDLSQDQRRCSPFRRKEGFGIDLPDAAFVANPLPPLRANAVDHDLQCPVRRG